MSSSFTITSSSGIQFISREYSVQINDVTLNRRIDALMEELNNYREERENILNTLLDTSQLLISQRDEVPLPQLDILSTIITEIDKNIDCPICYDSSKNEEFNKIFIKLNKCNHIFHKECIEKYIEIKKYNIVCPYCRTDFINT